MTMTLTEMEIEIRATQETFAEFADEVTAAIAAHRIILLSVLRTVLTLEQHATVMQMADHLIDAAPEKDERVRQMILKNVAVYKASTPRS